MQFCYGIQCFFSNVHGSDGIFSLRSTRGGLTGVRSCIVCRESFILLFPGTVMLEQSTVRKDAILKMLAGLLDGVDMGREVASPAVDEEEGKVEEERAVLGRLAQLSPRDRKAPCKNFFWKTFTSC
ncbi:cortistatin isoform X3 [Neopsephotus bourkii]|uniref:cortistatin isoform X3 n=1 Tax=Neopsephotus bourkii TaxID=309878 RepID=UPI002AA53F4B|nr:cortistatin isoform X3 [Neopsephotus bourkii]